MQNYLLVLLLSLVCVESIAHAVTMLLPKALRNAPIYHEIVQQFEGFSCGYNVLHNAALLEQRYGLSQKYAQKEIFTTTCMPFIRQCGLDPQGYSTNDAMCALAKKLHLKPFTYLRIQNDKVEYLPSDIYFPQPIAKKTLDQKLAELQDNFFKKQKGPMRIIHFACHIDLAFQEHVILMTVINDGKQTNLFIRDNLNNTITSDGQSIRYIRLLCKTFNIPLISDKIIFTDRR